MKLREEIKSHLIESREVILNGGVNCIPSPLTRFRQYFPGVRRGFYYVVTGATKSSKTQFTTFLFIINSVFYQIAHPEQIKVTILYFPLEETKDDIMLRIYAYIIAYITHNRILISPENLESVDERYPLSQEVLDIMDSDEFKMIADKFEECITFYEDRNATGIYKRIREYVESNGQCIYQDKEVTYKDEFGFTKTENIKTFVKYIPNNPNEYVIAITDHAGLLQEERGMNLKQNIEKLSEYFVLLRNKYKVIPVLVQQQNMETTNLEAYKANKIRPTKDGLKDSKRTGEDCTVLFGLTNPHAFELSQYQNYNIDQLKDCFRILEIVLARKGRANGLCPMFFNGAVNQYSELPLPNTPEMNQVYQYVNTLH
jgi:hypothetical protein